MNDFLEFMGVGALTAIGLYVLILFLRGIACTLYHKDRR